MSKTSRPSRSHAALAASVFVLFAAGQAAAASCNGTCGSLGANGDVTAPPGATTYGYVSTAGGPNGGGELAGIGGTNGSSFTTNPFTAAGGETLSYNFNYVTSDGQAQPDQFIYEDYASVQLVNLADKSSIILFDARSEPVGLEVPGQGLPPIDPGVTLTPATSGVTLGGGTQGNMSGGPVWQPLGAYSGWCWGPGCGYTGWINSAYTVPTAGTYELVFGVTNWGDTIYDSGLAYSGISIGGRPIEDAVPEPTSWVLALVGLGLSGGMMRAQRRRTPGPAAA